MTRRLHVASISGGKDSAAMSLLLTEQGIEHRRVFADTGWEAKETYDYIRGPLQDAIGEIEWLTPPLQMRELCIKKGMFPSRVRRFCTQELKVKPIYRYLSELVCAGQEVVNCIGIRAGESKAREKLPEHDGVRISKDVFVEIWRPLISWTTDQVIDIHKRHGLAPNPLYLRGAKRVGCWPCIFARKDEIRLLADTDPARVSDVEGLEYRLGVAVDARCEADGRERTRPTMFHSHDHDSRPVPFHEVVAWSRTSHGGRQLAMFGPQDSEEGCASWGLCESYDARLHGWDEEDPGQ